MAKYSLIAFGGGRHRCIGSTFAYQQIKVIWSTLLQRFDFTASTARPGPDYSTFVVGPRPPCQVRYRLRADGTRRRPAAAIQRRRDRVSPRRPLRCLYRRAGPVGHLRVVPGAPGSSRSPARQGALPSRQAVRGRGDRRRAVHLDRMGVLPAVLAAQEGGGQPRAASSVRAAPAPWEARTAERAGPRDRHQAHRARSPHRARRRRGPAPSSLRSHPSPPPSSPAASARGRSRVAAIRPACTGLVCWSRRTGPLPVGALPGYRHHAARRRVQPGVRACGNDRCTADGLVFYPRFLLPGYCGVVREADGDLNSAVT